MAHRIAEKVPEVAPLRVLPRGTAMVPDYRALMNRATSTRRFHGRPFDASLGPEFVDETDGQTKRHGGFQMLLDEPIVIGANDPYRTEYIRHLRDGDLWAADPATAQAAGVPFEPDFGGEHLETAALYAKAAPKGALPALSSLPTAADMAPKPSAGAGK